MAEPTPTPTEEIRFEDIIDLLRPHSVSVHAVTPSDSVATHRIEPRERAVQMMLSTLLPRIEILLRTSIAPAPSESQPGRVVQEGETLWRADLYLTTLQQIQPPAGMLRRLADHLGSVRVPVHPLLGVPSEADDTSDGVPVPPGRPATPAPRDPAGD